MSDFSGTPGKRTDYTAEISFTARELEALQRFFSRATVAGDVALVENVIEQILRVATKVE